MRDEYDKIIFNTATKIRKIYDVIFCFIIECLEYNPINKEFSLLKDKNLFIYLCFKVSNCNDKNLMSILKNNDNIEDIIEEAFSDIVMQKHKFAGEVKDSVIRELAWSEEITYFEEKKAVLDSLSNSKKLDELSYLFLERCSSLHKKKLYKALKTRKDTLKQPAPKSISVIFALLKTTIREAISTIKKDTPDKDKIYRYKSYLENIIYKWQNNANKKMPNKVTTSLSNLLAFSPIESNSIVNFEANIIALFDEFERIDNNSFLIQLLKSSFNNTQNDEKELSIKRLCTTIMDKKTYNARL